jgi:NADH dehydrogenase FAD-containing subunit
VVEKNAQTGEDRTPIKRTHYLPHKTIKKMSSGKKQVVIIGAGYGGATLARALDKQGGKNAKFEVKIISPRDFLLHKISSLRAGVLASEGWKARTMIPLDGLFVNNKGSKFIRGLVASVDEANKVVRLEDGTQVKYDVLVISSGGRSYSPSEPPAAATSKSDTGAYFDSFHAAVKQAKSVCIVGTGPTGIELAGEIRNAYKDKPITLISRDSGVLASKDTAYYLPQAFKDKATKKIKEQKIDLVFNDEVASPSLAEEDLNTSIPWKVTPGGVKLKSGKKLDCDLVVYCVGFKLATSFLPSAWLDSTTKEVLVEDNMLVKGQTNVFAMGDAAKLEGSVKGAYGVSENAKKVLPRNIVAVLDGKKPTVKAIKVQGAMMLPIGPNGGATTLGGMNLGNWVTKMIKADSLFTKGFRQDLNASGSYPNAKNTF